MTEAILIVAGFVTFFAVAPIIGGTTACLGEWFKTWRPPEVNLGPVGDWFGRIAERYGQYVETVDIWFYEKCPYLDVRDNVFWQVRNDYYSTMHERRMKGLREND